MYSTKIMQIAVTACALASRAYANGCLQPLVDNIGEFDVADAQNLQQSIAANTLNPPQDPLFYLGALGTYTIYGKNVKVCVSNTYLFENTHVHLGDVAFAVNYLLGSCGSAG